jgi:hypothetical protein
MSIPGLAGFQIGSVGSSQAKQSSETPQTRQEEACYSEEILASLLTVFHFLVVAPTDNAFSRALLESLLLPYPLGQ